MDEQIDRYYRIATKDWKYQVRGIIYLTLDGVKQAPQSIEETKILTRNIGAFTNNHNDLVNGWLIPCFNTSNDIDNKSLINQYIKLIKHLANKNMDNMVMDEFYKFVNQSNSINTIDTIIELKRRIPEYRANNFVIAIGNDFLPFRNYFYYKPNYRLYDKFIKDDNCFKLDIWFNDDGSIGILFWNTAKLNDEGAETVHRILKAIGYENEFHQRKGSGYLKYFTLSEEYKTMYDIDIAAINFVKNFMTSLR